MMYVEGTPTETEPLPLLCQGLLVRLQVLSLTLNKHKVRTPSEGFGTVLCYLLAEVSPGLEECLPNGSPTPQTMTSLGRLEEHQWAGLEGVTLSGSFLRPQ